MPPNPPSKRVALPRAAWRFAPCKYPQFSRKILNPPPPRNEILDTPLNSDTRIFTGQNLETVTSYDNVLVQSDGMTCMSPVDVKQYPV